MPIKRIEAKDVPAVRGSWYSIIKDLPEWVEAMQILVTGLRPYEAIVITFSSGSLERLAKSGLKHVTLGFGRLIKAYIKKKELNYDVRIKSGRKESDTEIYIIGR